MPQLLNRVQPGDVITAERWNLAVDAINQLLLAKPVAGVMVAALSPKGTQQDPIRINTILQITGQHFGYSTGQTKVSFEGPFGAVEVKRSDLLNGSSDSRLLLIVPSIPTMTEDGMTLTLRVDSGVAQDLRSVFVAPVSTEVTGDLFITLRPDVSPNPNPNPLNTTTAPAFAFRLESGISRPARFALSADVTDPSAALPAGFIEGIQFLNSDGSAIAGSAVEMGTEDVRNILVRTPVLTNLAGQSFTLAVTATAGSVTGSFSRTFTVGAPVAAPDSTIDARETGFSVRNPSNGVEPNPLNGTLDGKTIKLKKDYRITVIYNVDVTASEPYDLKLQPPAGTTATGWTAEFTTDTVNPLPGAGSHLVKFNVKPSGSSPAASGKLVFSIKRAGSTSDWSQEYTLQLL